MLTSGRVDVDRGVLRRAVDAAILAPSMFNAQPWRFRLADGGLEVWADRTRQLPVADATGWATRLACGAATANARLALAVAGVQVDVRLHPEPGEPDRLARLVPTGTGPATATEVELHAAIPRRYSNRRPFASTPVPPAVRAELRDTARARGAWLELLVGRAPLAVVAEITSAADTALRRDERYQQELVDWSRREPDSGHGIPLAAAGLAPAGQDLLALRDFGGPSRVDGHDYESDPLVAVLGTAGDTPYDQLLAGMAMQEVLLTAVAAGLAASLLSQPIEVPAAREQLRLGLGQYGAPQIVARIGYGPPGSPSPRRPAAEVIDG